MNQCVPQSTRLVMRTVTACQLSIYCQPSSASELVLIMLLRREKFKLTQIQSLCLWVRLGPCADTGNTCHAHRRDQSPHLYELEHRGQDPERGATVGIIGWPASHQNPRTAAAKTNRERPVQQRRQPSIIKTC